MVPNMQQWKLVSFLSTDQEEHGGFAVSFHMVSTRSSFTLHSVISNYPMYDVMPLQKWGVLCWQTLPSCSCSIFFSPDTESGLNFTSEVCRVTPLLTHLQSYPPIVTIPATGIWLLMCDHPFSSLFSFLLCLLVHGAALPFLWPFS